MIMPVVPVIAGARRPRQPGPPQPAIAPPAGLLPQDLGLCAWTIPPWLGTGSNTQGAGRIYRHKFRLTAGTTIGAVILVNTAAASGTLSVGIYSADGQTLLGEHAESMTSWTAAARRVIPGPAVTGLQTGGMYYLALLNTAGLTVQAAPAISPNINVVSPNPTVVLNAWTAVTAAGETYSSLPAAIDPETGTWITTAPVLGLLP